MRLSWEVLQDLQIIRCGEMSLSLASSLVWNGSFVPCSCAECCHCLTPKLRHPAKLCLGLWVPISKTGVIILKLDNEMIFIGVKLGVVACV